MGLFNSIKNVSSKIGGAIKGVSSVLGKGLKKGIELAGKIKEVVRNVPVIGEELANLGEKALDVPIPFLQGKSARDVVGLAGKAIEKADEVGGKLQRFGQS